MGSADTFVSFDGTMISYLDLGEGLPVLLHHGFAADARINWVDCGVTDALLAAGRRVVALDARGHGRSGKPHHEAAYADGAMVTDVRALLDHLAVERVDVVGYSMGSFVASRLALVEPRVTSVVLAGVGVRLATGTPPSDLAIADALVASDPSTVPVPAAQLFRAFADATGADRQALAACIRSAMFRSESDLSGIAVPALVLVGADDDLLGSPWELAEHLPDVRVEIVEGDHLTAVVDPTFAARIVAFLDEVVASEGSSVR